MLSEEESLQQDPRLAAAVSLFNAQEWYIAHDRFEELWHETQGPIRPALQGVLQIAVAHLHLERQNQHGATVLLGEGIGRLGRVGDEAMGLDLGRLRLQALERLQRLQQGRSLEGCSPLHLGPVATSPSVH